MAQKVRQPHGGAVNRFEKGESGNPDGRPPKGFKAFLLECKEQGFEQVSLSEITEAYQFLMNLPLAKVSQIAGDITTEKRSGDDSNTYPVVIRMVAAEMMGKRGQEMLKQVLDRAFGQSVAKEESEVKMVMSTKYRLDDGTDIEL